MNNEKKTISIIAPNIKNGGGKELLIYLIDYISESKEYNEYNFIVYVDKSFVYSAISNNIKLVVLDSVIDKILLFSKKIDNALYFGNLPPMVKSKDSILYFHSPYLLYSIKELFQTKARLIDKVKELLKQIYISKFIKNIDFVACQTENIKKKLKLKYNIKNVNLLPFYRVCRKKENIPKVFDFCYISLAHPHKNHLNLLKALEKISNKNVQCSIAVTIELEKYELIQLLEDINKKDIVKIINYGIVKKEKVCEIYQKSNCLIFPSLSETFGLPLLEASSLKIDIISSDLGYVYDVIEPSIVFNPRSVSSIENAITNYLNNKSKQTVLKTNNYISDLIKSLIKEK